MPVYCGDIREHNVRASKVKRRSKSFSRKAHRRSRCRKVLGEGRADTRCGLSAKKRCVLSSRKKSKVVVAILPPPAPLKPTKKIIYEEPAPKLKMGNSICQHLGKADCKKLSKKKNFPCRWVPANDGRKGYCSMVASEATQGEGWRK